MQGAPFRGGPDRALMASLAGETKSRYLDDDVEMDSPVETDALTRSQSPTDEERSSPVTLDKQQLGILCFARTIESWVYFSIFPFLPEMVERAGVENSATGYYTGVIESVFSLTEFIFVLFFWSTLADRIGRKPVLILCLTGLSASAALFGFCTSVTNMVLLRAIGGAFSGSLVIIRVMISEISTKETQPLAFSWFATTGCLANFLAPLTGGLLADAAERYSLFRGVPLWTHYPYLLPCLSSGVLGGAATILCILYLKETKPASLGPKGSPNAAMPIMQLLRCPGVFPVFFLSVAMNFNAYGFAAISPVSWHTPVRDGGLGMSTQSIASYMGATGLMQGIVMFLVFSKIHRAFGTRGTIHVGMMALCITCVAQVWLNRVAKVGYESLFGLLCGGVLVTMSLQPLRFTALQLAINDATPGPENLGRLVSICISAALAIRAISPSFWSAMFAYSVEHQIWSGYLAWIAMAAANAAIMIATQILL